MLEELLAQQEGKTLEFKANTQGLQKIIQTIIAFANTAGGMIVVGVEDKTKDVIGLSNILQDEEKISSAIADSIHPLLFPSIDLCTWRDKDVLIVKVAHSYGPYYLKAKGVEGGTYMRLGSTNRLADQEAIQEIQKLRHNKPFDEQANVRCPIDQVQFGAAKELFAQRSKKFNESTASSLGLIVEEANKVFPSNAAVILFGKSPVRFFPNVLIRLGRFLGNTKADEVVDQQDLDIPIVLALDHILMFIRRHTNMGARIRSIRRENIPQYPELVVREAVINMLVHTDYGIGQGVMTIAIFDDRMEITNPGSLPYGFTLKAALSGVSRLRNRVIGRVFRELDFIEQWGTGLNRMINICLEKEIQIPKFEELDMNFRVTLYHAKQKKSMSKPWQHSVVEYVGKNKEITGKQAQKLWKVTGRTATSRLKMLCQAGILVEIATSSYDPYKTFRLAAQ
jgi:predicted HTH transcriptional regulator